MDWNQEATASRRILNVSKSTAGVADDVHGPFFVGDLQSLSFFYLAQTANVSSVVTFAWFTDKSMLVQLYSENIQVRPGAVTGDQATWTMPISAPYLRVTVTPYLSNVTYILQLWSGPPGAPSYNISPAFANANRQILFSASSVFYPIGTTIIDGSAIIPGDAYFLGEVVTNLSSLTLYAVDYTNSEYILSKHLQSNGLNTKPVMLPPMHIRLKVVNLTAGAVEMSYSLTAKYGLL